MKKMLIRGAALCLALVMTVLCTVSCSEKNEGAVIRYVSDDGKTTATLDSSFMSLWIAVQNYQYLSYISAFDAAQGWDTVVDKQTGARLKDVMLDEAVRTASSMLEAEYLHDNVYKIEFSDEQEDSVNEYINSLVVSKGSQKALESELSMYGTSISALRRYMTLMLKYETLYESFYNENGIRKITEQQKQSYFEENYAIIDHILFDMRGKQKDDGTVIPLTEEEENAKTAAAEELYSAISAGVVGFDEAKELYNEDAYAEQYPFGYFVTDDNTFWSEFQHAALEMQEGEIRLVRTYAGLHIMRKNPMKGELYTSNGNFYDSLGTILSQEDFLLQLEGVSDGIAVNDSAAEKLDVSLIKPFAFDSYK